MLRRKSEPPFLPSAPYLRRSQVVLLYHPADQEQATEVHAMLQGAGYNCLLFEPSASLDTVSAGVASADAVLVALSSDYKDSSQCRTQANFAYYELGRKMVFLQATPGYRADGWLAELVRKAPRV